MTLQMTGQVTARQTAETAAAGADAAAGAAPVFILGMQRGGTNQLLNILRSHPDTAWPDGELHEVLRPKWNGRGTAAVVAGRALSYLPVLLRHGDVLSPHKLPRAASGPARRRLQRWIARRLEQETARNAAEVARFRAAMAAQGFAPARPPGPPRMVVKLVNFNAGLARDLHRIYPGARFIGITRDAAGVCESMISRGMPPERVLPLYHYVAHQLLALQGSGFPILLLRFEEIIADIQAASTRVYRWCGLEAGAVSGFCLQDKTRLLDRRGRVAGLRKVDAFYPAGEAARHLRGDVNSAARSRLPEALRREIGLSCGPVMRQLGYGPDPAPGA